jgi:hypothetical protein
LAEGFEILLEEAVFEEKEFAENEEGEEDMD